MRKLQDMVSDVLRYIEVAIVLFNDMDECTVKEEVRRNTYSLALEDALDKLSLLVTDLQDAINEAAAVEKGA